MRSLAPLLLVPLLLLLAAFRGQGDPTPRPVDPGGPPPSANPAHVIARRAALTPRIEYAATLVPAEASELSLWPRAHAGALTFVEVQPHGAMVGAGDVVARLESSGLEREVDAAGRATRAAELALRTANERGQLAQAAAAVARAEAQRILAEAREDLASWKDHELAALTRSDELAAQQQQHWIDDAQDELTQLELMYADDELVQATEEIVLRRSRRDLAHQREAAKLADERRARGAALRARTTAARERALRAAERALSDLAVEQALAAAQRGLALEAARADLAAAQEREAGLAADLEAFSLRAPRDGVLLHGSQTGWGAGQRAEHQRGGPAAARTGLFLVADPDRLAAVFDLPAADRRRAPHGAGVQVRPQGSEAQTVGRLEVARYPSAAGMLAARVSLQRPMTGQTAGSPATVLVEGEAAQALLLPRAAVHESAGAHWCWVAAGDDAYRRVPVRVLAEHAGDLSIEGDVPEGARVLLAAE